MKNIFLKSILSCLILLCSIGCQDELTELYQDPDGFSKSQADEAGVSIIAGYFTSQLTRGFFLRGDYGSQYHQLRSGSRLMGTGVQLYYTNPEDGVPYTLTNVENDWGSNAFNQSVFNSLNSEWIKQVLWGQKEFNRIPEEERTTLDILFMKLLHALKAYAYQRAIDQYDEVPYFRTGSAGALDGEKAEFLGQEEIYPIIIKELGEIETYLATVELDASEQAVFQSQDVIFDGSLMQWRKYINSLRLRWAMTVSERMPELTSATIAELNGKQLFTEPNDVAGLADIAIVEPNRLQVELGITRSFRERADECRAPKHFLQDVMHCIPTEKSKVVNGQTLFYFEAGSDCSEGLSNGTVDPRIAYLFSKDIMERYVGAETAWDNGTDPNSYLSKAMRGYYINHPIMDDINVKEISFGTDANPQTIKLSSEAAADLSKREAFLLNAFREYCVKYNDNNYTIGTDRNMISEYNTRPQYNFDIRYPTLHAVETELSLAEAAVRGLGEAGSAHEHYARAIELSCNYWYGINANNRYSKQTVPSFPSNMDQSRIARDRPEEEYNAVAYAEFEAQRFDGLTDQEKVRAIFNQLQLHYNMFNFETPYTTARRLVKYLGDNPASPYDIIQWKERFLYNPNIQATDPEAWARISQHDNPNLPVWFTGRDSKWNNVLE